MNRSTLATVALTIVALAPLSQAQQSLTFTTLGSESTASGSSGSTLGQITPEDVAIVSPGTGVYSAETYANHLNWNTLAGDGDTDAFYHQPNLAGAIDALQPMPSPFFGYTLRELYFSTAQNLPCANGGVIGTGDVSAIRIGAGENPMIDEIQIRDALGITPNTLFLNVDAITRDGAGSLYLSFENDVWIQLGTDMLFDGGIAFIPATAITWAGNTVIAVTPNTGVIALNENAVNLRVVNANVADVVGNFVQNIGDLDGLALNPSGGFFINGGGMTFPNLIFCGEMLTGGGILSTAVGGSIATVNGIPMATTFGSGATDGTQVGLDPVGVSSLNGLAITAQTNRFITDTATPFIPSPGPINFTAGGADPGQPIFFYARVFGVNSVGGFQPSVPAFNPCFPEWYLNNTFLFSFPSDGLGIVDLTLSYGGGVPVGNTVVLQGVTPKAAGWSLSAPITYQF